MKNTKQFKCQVCGAEETTKSNGDAKHGIDRCISCYEIWHKADVLQKRKAQEASLAARMAMKKEAETEELNEFLEAIDSEVETLISSQDKKSNNYKRTKKQTRARLTQLQAERELKQIEEYYA